MSPNKIRKRIDENNKKIEELFVPGSFTLNYEVQELINANQKLQNQCKHKFINGICKYCDKEE